MKKILLVFLGITSGCAAKKQLAAGCYQAKNDNLIVASYLQLKPDSTYYFYTYGDMYRSAQEGHWIIKKNKLVLNSNIQPKTKGYYKEGKNNFQTQVQFELFDIDGKPLNDKKNVYIKQGSNYIPLTHQTGNVYVVDKNKLSGNYVIGIGSEYKEVKIAIKGASNNKISVFLVPDKKGFFQVNKQFKINDSVSFNSKTSRFVKINCDK